MSLLRTMESRALVAGAIAIATAFTGLSSTPAMAQAQPTEHSASQGFNQAQQTTEITYKQRTPAGQSSTITVTHVPNTLIRVQENGASLALYADGRVISNGQELQFTDANQRNQVINRMQPYIQGAFSALQNNIFQQDQNRGRGRSAIQTGSAILLGQPSGFGRQILNGVTQGRAIRDQQKRDDQNRAFVTFRTTVNNDFNRFRNAGQIQAEANLQNSAACKQFRSAVKSTGNDPSFAAKLRARSKNFEGCKVPRR